MKVSSKNLISWLCHFKLAAGVVEANRPMAVQNVSSLHSNNTPVEKGIRFSVGRCPFLINNFLCRSG